MRAVMFSEYGGPEVLEVGERPDPQPGLGQVRVRVAAAAVNPADTAYRAGYLQQMTPHLGLPGAVGWDVAGVVDALGPVVTAWQPGDRVLGLVHHLGTGVGTNAEFVVLDELDLAAIPDGIGDTAAASLPLAGLTAVQALALLDLPPGRRLLVTGGVGSVGGMTIQLAAQRGLEVVASVSSGDAEHARALGAAEVVDRHGDVAAQVRGVFTGGVDGALDAAASGEPIAAVRDGGRFVAVTAPALPGPQRGVRVRLVRVQPDGRQLGELAALLAEGRLDPREITTLPFTAAAEAHHLVEKGGIRGKVVLVP